MWAQAPTVLELGTSPPAPTVVSPSLVSGFSFHHTSEIRVVTAVYKMLCDQPSGIVLEPRIVEQMSFA